MNNTKQSSLINTSKNNDGPDNPPSVKDNISNRKSKEFKKELMSIFRKFGYLNEECDHEVTFRTTSGNIAWININSIETIK